MKKQVLAVAAAAIGLAACDGFKEAMTAHVDVVARAGSQELSVTRLSDLLGNSKAPLRKDVAKAVAELWVNYQLLGKAAADNDSLNATKTIDDAMWAELANARAKKWYDVVSKTWSAGGEAQAESRYNQGDILAARHILLMAPEQGLSTGARDSIRRKAESIRTQVTAANFAQMANKNSMDPGSNKNGGLYAGFPRGQMVPEFEKALLALKPGEISPVVQTQFGYHIIYRPTFNEVRSEVVKAADQRGMQVAESTYFAKLEAASNVQIRPDAAKTVKAVAADLPGNANNTAVVATWKGGELTAGRVDKWISAYPPRAQLPQQIQQAPDSVIPNLVRNFVRNELFLKQADSAKLNLDSSEVASIRGNFTQMIGTTWRELGIDPKVLADSAKTSAARERVASARVEDYMDNLLMRDGRFVDVPKPLETALHTKYEFKINDAGLDRAVERATKVRATVDSTRAAQQPKSVVPMPGQTPGQGGAAGQAGQPQAGQAPPAQPAPKAGQPSPKPAATPKGQAPAAQPPKP